MNKKKRHIPNKRSVDYYGFSLIHIRLVFIFPMLIITTLPATLSRLILLVSPLPPHIIFRSVQFFLYMHTLSQHRIAYFPINLINALRKSKINHGSNKSESVCSVYLHKWPYEATLISAALSGIVS